ncbi:MAG: hypothetical protein HYV09_35760 [Deltaproteobacteria bacterium]|nr:hypothetical protein [Deltaproteobacteria bacterium]
MKRSPLALLALLAMGLLACPSAREGGGAPDSGTVASIAQAPRAPSISPGELASATVTPADDRIIPLASGEKLAPESAADGEVSGVELLFDVRLRNVPAPPLHLGAVPGAIATAQATAVGTMRATVGAGRVRVRFGRHAFAMEDGWELRADRRRGGAILLYSTGGTPAYRVVPTGALRPLLSERRVDVVPLGPTHLASLAPGTHLGRETVRTRVITAWGVLDLDQIAVSSKTSVSAGGPAASATPRPDARVGDAEAIDPGLDGGGDSLCRALVELVASDRAIGGAPCATDLVPVRADVSFTNGGGVIIDASNVREGAVFRADLSFPPAAARASSDALADPKLPPFAAQEALLAIRAKGEPSSLELLDKSPSPRVAVIDGVPAWLLPAGGEARVSLRAGRYVVEWRSPLGEIVERASEVEVPGRATVSQWVPAPLSSASPMASARNGP